MRFEWDEDKARLNAQKHGVTFEEAETVFFEEEAWIYDDPDHSEDEQRFLLVGPSASLRLLVVVHCFREDGEIIRIISVRKATRRERRAFMMEGSPHAR
ncbi:MAG: BrnT family toxin [Deltaproteobacteria bacterium]|nr:BrnT family toxin [Deltaproteobacteria bacterium]